MSSLAGPLGEVADLLELAQAQPLQAAAILEEWGSQLFALAARLRLLPPVKDTVSEGGIGDRVEARVFGPDGRIKGIGGAG